MTTTAAELPADPALEWIRLQAAAILRRLVAPCGGDHNLDENALADVLSRADLQHGLA